MGVFIVLCIIFIGGNTVTSETDIGTAPTICSKPIDLVFVVDTSRSLSRKQYKTQMAFVESLTGQFKVGAKTTQVSVVQFSHYVRKLFCFNDYLTNKDLIKGIAENAKYRRGSTYTSKALKTVRDDIIHSEACGARADDKAAKIVILMTDGRANFPSKAMKEAGKLKATGVKLVIIGIGGKINKDDLNKMASTPAVSFTDIKFTNLESIKTQVSEEACVGEEKEEEDTCEEACVGEKEEEEDTCEEACVGEEKEKDTCDCSDLCESGEDTC